MKKLLTCIAIIAIVMCTSLMVVPFTTAMAMELDGDEYDQVFRETINELGGENYVGDLAVSASKEIVYDLHINALGFVYDFTVNGERGYAIIINVNGYAEVMEIFFGAEHPYGDVEEGKQWIYVQAMIYLVYSDNAYYSTEGELLSEETIASLEEKAYFVLSDLVFSSETITFVSKTEDKYDQVRRHPAQVTTSTTTTTCGTIAGSNIIQYWDRYNTNLIADYSPGVAIGTQYLYHLSGANLTAVADQLYYDMSGEYGVTISEFINGIGTYCSRQGYTSTFNLLTEGGSNFNYTSVKQALTQNMPVAIFLGTFTVVDINTNNNIDTLNKYTGSIPHIMVGFGYKDITYTLSSGTRVDRYISVATGVVQMESGYFNVNNTSQIDAVYSVNIA